MTSTHPKRLREQLRRTQALEMRLAGHTFEEIGRTLGIDRGNAHRLVAYELKKVKQRTGKMGQELLEQYQEQLEEWLDAIAPKTKKGDLAAIQTGLKIMERMARLWGLDAPTKSEVKSGLGDLTDAELIQQAKQWGVPVSPEFEKELSGEVSPVPEGGKSNG